MCSLLRWGRWFRILGAHRHLGIPDLLHQRLVVVPPLRSACLLEVAVAAAQVWDLAARER